MNILKKLENYPIGVCGTSLALITLSNAWAINGINFLKPLAIGFAICALSLMLLRIIIFPKKIVQEFTHPVMGSFYPTIDMTLLLIAAFFLKTAPNFSRALWITAVVIHLTLFVLFFIVRLRKFKFEHMVPSWFVVLIGVDVACVTSPGMGFGDLAKILFYFGFFWYVVTWPIMLYRVFKYKKLEENHLPTIGIMAAPGSLCLVGYITAFESLNPIIVLFLLITSLFNLLLVYTYIIDFIKKGFAPTYAALTFPLAISIMAMYKMSGYVTSIGINGSAMFKLLGDIEIFIGTGVIFYVAFNFIRLFIFAISPKKEEALEKDKSLFGKVISEEILPDDKVEELLK